MKFLQKESEASRLRNLTTFSFLVKTNFKQILNTLEPYPRESDSTNFVFE